MGIQGGLNGNGSFNNPSGSPQNMIGHHFNRPPPNFGAPQHFGPQQGYGQPAHFGPPPNTGPANYGPPTSTQAPGFGPPPNMHSNPQGTKGSGNIMNPRAQNFVTNQGPPVEGNMFNGVTGAQNVENRKPNQNIRQNPLN